MNEGWDKRDWAAEALAQRTPAHDPNPCVPDWMKPIIAGKWKGLFETPAPTVAELRPSAHDWFREADIHEDFSLGSVDTVHSWSPSIEQLRSAWYKTQVLGAVPLVHMEIAPDSGGGERHVTGFIEGFFVAAEGHNERIATDLFHILGKPPHVPIALNIGVIRKEAGFAHSDHRVTLMAWQWLFAEGWDENEKPA